MRNAFRGFGAVFYKEVLHVRRDFATLFFSLIIPILQMVLLGFGIDTNVRQINTVVFNADDRRESRELLDRLKNSDTFHIIRYVENDNDMNDAIISGSARVGIKIPVDYSDRLLHGTERAGSCAHRRLGLFRRRNRRQRHYRHRPRRIASARLCRPQQVRSPWICAHSCSSIPILARRIFSCPVLPLFCCST